MENYAKTVLEKYSRLATLLPHPAYVTETQDTFQHKTTRFMKKALFMLLLLGCILPTRAFTQTNFLDTTFADNGSAIININDHDCDIYNVGLQSDGKIIAIGVAATDDGGRAFVARLNADGSRDTSFGNGGEWLSEDPYFLRPTEVLIQPDDKIVITGLNAGYTRVVRLNPDGIYDNSFGVNGQSDLIIGALGGQHTVVDMKLQPDGKILLSGSKSPGAAIVRLNVDGTFDTSFGASGILLVSPNLFWPAAYQVGGLQLGLSSDNAILAAGVYGNNSILNTGFLIRFNNNGQLDTAFGENGITNLNGQHNTIADLFILPTDEILVLCSSRHTTNVYPKTVLIKCLPSGQIDTSFANNGYAQLTIGNEGTTCQSGFMQPDGKVTALSVYNYPGTIGDRTMMSRFNTDGSMDTSFGDQGVITAPEQEVLIDGFVQPDGKIISVSYNRTSDELEYGKIQRYLASNTVGVIESASAISSASLFPNPVTEHNLTIAYELPEASNVKIDLISLKGEILQTLVNAERTVGKNEEVLKLPENLENGTYFVNIQSERGNAVAKFLFIGR